MAKRAQEKASNGLRDNKDIERDYKTRTLPSYPFR